MRKLFLACLLPLASAQNVMPWWCLERCGGDITAQQQHLASKAEYMTAIAWECWDLGSNGALLPTGYTNVNSFVKGLGLLSYPMITTVSIESLHELFASPQAFITQAVQTAVQNGYSGYNLDFEPCQGTSTSSAQAQARGQVKGTTSSSPTSSPTTQPTTTGTGTTGDGCSSADGVAYATFLNLFADAMHAAQMTLSTSVATWSPFWDYDALANTSVDKFNVMSTYVQDAADFTAALNEALDAFGPDRTGVGICTSGTSGCFQTPWTQAEAAAIFQIVAKSGVTEVDFWDVPLGEYWWPLVAQWQGKAPPTDTTSTTTPTSGGDSPAPTSSSPSPSPGPSSGPSSSPSSQRHRIKH